MLLPQKMLDRCRHLLPLLLVLLPGMALGQPQVARYDPGIALPEGEGRALLLAACTLCHDLKGLPVYRKYWNRDQWRSMVDGMVDNGAPLDEQSKRVVIDYLARHFGTATD